MKVDDDVTTEAARARLLPVPSLRNVAWAVPVLAASVAVLDVAIRVLS